MKYAAVIAALAAAAIAAPTNGGGSSDICNNKPNNPNNVCCTGVLGLLSCTLNLLGETCSGKSYCCQSAPQNGLINIGLDCVKVL